MKHTIHAVLRWSITIHYHLLVLYIYLLSYTYICKIIQGVQRYQLPINEYLRFQLQQITTGAYPISHQLQMLSQLTITHASYRHQLQIDK